MKLGYLCVAAGLALALSTSAMAQSPGGQSGQAGGGQFDQRKAALLQKLSDHIAQIQQRRDCAQAATDGASLKACFPKGGRRGGGDGASGGDDEGADSDQ